ncbi:hypothetical protein C0995_006516, partial [Termitomyces sp. Mi166
GTLPYMSGDVIARKTLHIPPGFKSPPPFVHQAIHDVESLFWVLVNLCLTRKGPGAEMRREELDNDSPSHTRLREIVDELFESKNDETLKEAKKSRHEQWELFGDEVVAYFHPYFEPLKPYVLKWWNTLILGYRFRGEEFYNIHNHILRILKDAR